MIASASRLFTSRAPARIAARKAHEEALAIRRAIGNKPGVAMSLNNLYGDPYRHRMRAIPASSSAAPARRSSEMRWIGTLNQPK